MYYPSYSFRQSASANQFFFESFGKHGVIKKAVAITATGINEIYNLGFGDYNMATDEIDDLSVSDNGDTTKILATIFKIVDLYLSRYPSHQIVFSGNTPARNRLYRMAINKELELITQSYMLFGFCNDSWKKFEPIHNYELFLVSKK